MDKTTEKQLKDNTCNSNHNKQTQNDIGNLKNKQNAQDKAIYVTTFQSDEQMQQNYSKHYWEQSYNFQQPYNQNYKQQPNMSGWKSQQNYWRNQGFYQPVSQNPNYYQPHIQNISGCSSNMHGFIPHYQPNFQYQPFPGYEYQQVPFQVNNQNNFHENQYRSNQRGFWRNLRGGRGRFRQHQHKNHGNHKHHHFNKQKWCKQRQNQCTKTKQCEQSSAGTSSSDNQCEQLQKKLCNLSLKNKKQEIIESFFQCLNPFFNKYKVSQGAKYRTINYLIKRFSKLEELDPLVTVLYSMESEQSQYLNSPYFSLFVIIKQIIKKQYKMDQIYKILQKKTFLKQKKMHHDSKFQEKFPDAAHIQFLEQQDLIKLDYTKTLFLVDGNNIMSKQKIFRKYFQSQSIEEKAQGQIRLVWLFSQSLASQIFFDNKYEMQVYQRIKESILSQEQLVKVNNTMVYYAQKQINKDNTADMKIVSRLSQIVENGEYKGFDIVLVSADKQLSQLCNAIKPLKRTSGMYIFKYCKNVIKQKNRNNPQKKGIIKRIFTY